MEGKNLSVILSRSLAAIILIAASQFVLCDLVFSQVWPTYSGSFLEPTQFTLVKSTQDRTLRLQMGYGTEIAGSRVFRVGAEGLLWSRLRALPDFRFPVERADYFFGIFSRFALSSSDSSRSFRIRISHISSHVVDGAADTVLGGSSSHYSREFVTLEKVWSLQLGAMPIVLSAGVRYVFHQVTQVESVLQIPIVLEANILPLFTQSRGMDSPSRQGVLLTLSSASDPSGASIGGFLTLRSELISGSLSDLYLGYRYGPSMEGNDALQKSSQVEVGLRMEPSW